MIDQEIEPTRDAMDKSFRYIGDQWAKDFHLCLELPGKFKELLQNDTVKDPKTGIRMDLLELVEMEGGILMLTNIEHQSKKLDNFKISIIDDYKNYSKCKYNLPLLSVIVSPYTKNEQINEFRSTESDILQPLFITIDDAEIKKRLNILKSNIRNKDIENSIVLNIAIISIFVLNNKYEILKELCKILKHAIGVKGKIKIDMTKVLEEMIKYKLQDNVKQAKELLKMLEEEKEIARRGIRIWYEEEFEQIEEQHEKELAEKDEKHTIELAEKDEKHAIELAEKNIELAQKDKKIAELTAKLKANGMV